MPSGHGMPCTGLLSRNNPDLNEQFLGRLLHYQRFRKGSDRSGANGRQLRLRLCEGTAKYSVSCGGSYECFGKGWFEQDEQDGNQIAER
jgi:hypothetical protein